MQRQVGPDAVRPEGKPGKSGAGRPPESPQHTRVDPTGGRTSLASETATLKVGDMAPDFTLESHMGGSVRLSELRGHRNVLLAFIPLDWHQRTRMHVLDYEVHEPHLESLEAEALIVATESVPTLKHWAVFIGGLTIPTLSDYWPHGAVSKAYGVFREDVGMAGRVLLVIDRGGKIAYIDVHKTDEKPDVSQVMDVLKALHDAASPARTVHAGG